MNRFVVYAFVVLTMTSCSSWTRMFGQIGSGAGSSWSSRTGGGGGSYGGGSGGGGHK